MSTSPHNVNSDTAISALEHVASVNTAWTALRSAQSSERNKSLFQGIVDSAIQLQDSAFGESAGLHPNLELATIAHRLQRGALSTDKELEKARQVAKRLQARILAQAEEYVNQGIKTSDPSFLALAESQSTLQAVTTLRPLHHAICASSNTVTGHLLPRIRPSESIVRFANQLQTTLPTCEVCSVFNDAWDEATVEEDRLVAVSDMLSLAEIRLFIINQAKLHKAKGHASCFMYPLFGNEGGRTSVMVGVSSDSSAGTIDLTQDCVLGE